MTFESRDTDDVCTTGTRSIEEARHRSILAPSLLSDVEARIFSYLSLNELAGTVRLVNKAAAARFRGPQHATLRLSQPVPPHAFQLQWGRPGAMRGLTYYKRLELLTLTARSGSLPNLQRLGPAVGIVLPPEVLEAAASAGHLAVCQWLLQQGCPVTHEALDAAGRSGRWEVCEWVMAESGRAQHKAAALVTCGAAAAGHVGLVDRLIELYGASQESEDALVWGAAVGCDLATLQRLAGPALAARRADAVEGGYDGDDKQGLPEHSSGALVAAAAGSPTPDWRAKVAWLCDDLGCIGAASACAAAASRPDALDRVRWLDERWHIRRRFANGRREAAEEAARRGDAATLRFLLEFERWERKPDKQGRRGRRPEGPMAREAAMITLASSGQLEALRQLHAEGWPLDSTDAFWFAAAGGHLHVLQWAAEALLPSRPRLQQYFCSPKGLSHAAGSGSVPLMAWLRRRGCGWRRDVWECAARAGCEEALEWLAEEGCPMSHPEGPISPYTGPLLNGDLATLACLRRLGCPWSARTFTCAAEVAPLPALRWLAEAGCPADWAEALGKAGGWRGRDRDAKVAWLEEQQRRARPQP